jgi:hypothetical protein
VRRLTTYNALRSSGGPGDLVAILARRLGHLGCSSPRGWASARSPCGGADAAARETARAQLISTARRATAAELQKLGGARVIVATVTNGEAMSAVMGASASPARSHDPRRAGSSRSTGLLIGGRQSVVACTGDVIDS